MPPAHIPTREELFARLRFERDQRLAAHDAVISQLSRKQRLGEDVAERLQALDAYAEQLCNLPAQDGAPWDGGGEATPWPEQCRAQGGAASCARFPETGGSAACA